MHKPLKVGLCGLGTVGSGTFNVLKRNARDIERRAGRPIVVEHVGARRDTPNCDTGAVRVSRDIFDVVRDPEVDVIVELIGGNTAARELVLAAIAHGKHVVTANKALLAEQGDEIFSAAAEKGVIVAYEAAVAGGIPIIKALREGLSANRIEWLGGIINGTGNFILTHMRDEGRSFDDVLAEAQALGYAEADPTFDVEGIDAAHKLTLLASAAFGIPLQFERVYTEGISRLTQEDITQAGRMGYVIKHLGIARQTDKGIELRVHPTLVPASQLLANVNGALNAVEVMGDAVGPTLYYGAGAGSEETASAVIADLIDVARDMAMPAACRTPYLGFNAAADGEPAPSVLPMDEVVCSYYLRLVVEDRPGVLAAITAILAKHSISIESMLQCDCSEGANRVNIILLTHEASEADMNAAIACLEALGDVVHPAHRIRVEHFGQARH